MNDNKPKFSQLKYESSVTTIFNRDFHQEVLKFDVRDKDLGVYGEAGIRCELFGDESDKFEIDHAHQTILLKPCPKCPVGKLKPVYKLELVCNDDLGKDFDFNHNTVSF